VINPGGLNYRLRGGPYGERPAEKKWQAREI